LVVLVVPLLVRRRRAMKATSRKGAMEDPAAMTIKAAADLPPAQHIPMA
jgi:hypothetical protein